MSFNLTKFCFLAGNAVNVSDSYRITLLVIFSAIGLGVILINTIALLIMCTKRTEYFKKEKVVMLSLVTIDLLSGCTVIPLFMTELSKSRTYVNCELSSLRVLFFGYLLSCRILAIFLTSFQMYVKMNKQNTVVEHWFNYFLYAICMLFVWIPGILFILAVGFSQVKTDKVLGTVVFIPVVIVVIGSIACYMTVLKTIKRADARHESAVYKEGASYIKQVLIWFLLTNIPLGICGLVLLIYAFNLQEKERDYKVIQQIYVFCLAITAIDAIINPYYLLRKHSDLNAYVTKKVASFKSSLRSPKQRRRGEDVDIMNDLSYYTFNQTVSVNPGFDEDGGNSMKSNGNTPHGSESKD